MIPRPFAAPRVELGIDLGTASTRVIERGRILFDQPSLCCFKAYDAVPLFIAAGEEARSYQSKIARPLKVIHPLQHGVLSDMAATRELLRFACRSAGVRRIARVRPAIGVTADSTQAEKRALVAASTDAGFLEPLLVPEPLLAARGLDLAIDQPRGHMIVDCGAGAIDVAVVSLGGLCVSETLRSGGLALDGAIIDHLHLNHRFQIGPRSAEQLKFEISQAFGRGAWNDQVSVRGSDLAAGLPRTLTLPASEFRGLWMRFVTMAAATVRKALARTSPELMRDIHDGGIYLTGAAANTALLGSTISDHAGVCVHIAAEPDHAVARGLAKVANGHR